MIARLLMKSDLANDVDSCAMLNPPTRAAFTRVLSAIQTSELMEHHVLEPLRICFQHNREAAAFLSVQSGDEQRHGEMIRDYLLATFGYTKTAPTFSDRIFYTLLFPLARRFVFNKAQVAIALILFYEHFSVGLYRQLLRAAQHHKLSLLTDIIESILRDEGLHISGLRKLHATFQTKLSLFESCLLKGSLTLLSIDVNFAPWAFHNRSIRKSLQQLTIDPDAINALRKRSLDRVSALILSLPEIP